MATVSVILDWLAMCRQSSKFHQKKGLGNTGHQATGHPGTGKGNMLHCTCSARAPLLTQVATPSMEVLADTLMLHTCLSIS